MSDDALILAVWDAVSSDEALVTLLAQLAEAFDCHSSALVYKNSLTPAADIRVAHGPFTDADVRRRYELHFAELDPAPAALGRLALGEVADTDTLFPEAERQPYRAFLDGFYHPLGLYGALGAPLCKGDARIGMIAIHRGAARRPYVLRVSRRAASAGWLILVSDPVGLAGSRPAALAAALGISIHASEVVAALLEGETLNAFCKSRFDNLVVQNAAARAHGAAG